MASNTSSSSGISFMGLLGVLFIGLKLTGYIDWSWWWVTAPLWGPVALVLSFLVIALVCVFVYELGKSLANRKNQ